MDTEQSVQQGLGNHYQPNHYNVQQVVFMSFILHDVV